MNGTNWCILPSSQPTNRFSLHTTVRFGNKAQNANFRPKNDTKNYTYLPSIFNPNICSKVKVYIYSKPHGQTLVSHWQFNSSQSFPQVAVHQPFYQTESIEFFTTPNCLGRFWNPSTKRPERQQWNLATRTPKGNEK